jgi:hypothetical protein
MKPTYFLPAFNTLPYIASQQAHAADRLRRENRGEFVILDTPRQR